LFAAEIIGKEDFLLGRKENISVREENLLGRKEKLPYCYFPLSYE
jgi:hypothetical protein